MLLTENVTTFVCRSRRDWNIEFYSPQLPPRSPPPLNSSKCSKCREFLPTGSLACHAIMLLDMFVCVLRYNYFVYTVLETDTNVVYTVLETDTNVYLYTTSEETRFFSLFK
jgi:hypothetical protein